MVVMTFNEDHSNEIPQPEHFLQIIDKFKRKNSQRKLAQYWKSKKICIDPTISGGLSLSAGCVFTIGSAETMIYYTGWTNALLVTVNKILGGLCNYPEDPLLV